MFIYHFSSAFEISAYLRAAFLLEREVFRGAQKGKGDHIMSKGIVEIMRQIPDPRTGNAIRHKLEEILTIAILAIICDYSQFPQLPK